MSNPDYITNESQRITRQRFLMDFDNRMGDSEFKAMAPYVIKELCEKHGLNPSPIPSTNNQRGGEKVLRWVRASERLPIDGEIKAAKTKGRYLELRVSKEGIIVAGGYSCHTLEIMEEWFPGIEWLEETDAPAALVEELPSHEDIPVDYMRKIYNTVQCWNDEIKPFMLKGMVQGYLLAIGKLPKFTYLTDVEMTDLIMQHIFQDPGGKVPAQPTETPSLPVDEVPQVDAAIIDEWFPAWASKKKLLGLPIEGPRIRDLLRDFQADYAWGWIQHLNKLTQECCSLRTQLAEAQALLNQYKTPDK